jgi:hypothetical protein
METKRMSMTVVPVQLGEGVETWLAQLGMQKELQTMIDWVQQNVPGVQGIRVELAKYESFYLEGKRHATIWAHCDLPAEEVLNDVTLVGWGIWKAQTFSARVCVHFTMMCAFQPL